MDISQQALNEAKKVSKFICKSALNLKDIDVYDIIIINHVLYHIDKMIKKF
jgi:2-polyprenyl-3-methyl-5-hydroxy-6-metoxy-1,4-benzoquinol methylase